MGSPTCPACSHPPHLGACSRRMGGTAYSCGCLRQTPTPPAPAADASGAEAMRHNAAEVARRGAVAAYEMMAAASPDVAQNHTYADCMEAVGKALDECESMIRALPLPARADAVEEARRAFYEAARAFCEEARIAVVTEMLGGRNMIEPARNFAKPMLAAYDALLAAERDAALRRAKGGA